MGLLFFGKDRQQPFKFCFRRKGNLDFPLFPVLPHLDGNVSPQGHLQLILQPGQVSIRLRTRLGLAHQMAHQGLGLAGRQVMLQNVQGRFTLQFRRRQL